MADKDTDDLLRSAERSASKAQPTVDALLASDESELYAALAQRVSEAAQGSSAISSFEARIDSDELKRGPALEKLGKRIFQRWNSTLHSFLCKDSGEDKDLRDRVLKAITSKDGGAAALVAGTLVAVFGVSPAISVLVAALLIKLIVQPAGEEICKAWGESIEAAAGEGRPG